MLTKRIIPCLDVKNGRVVKGIQFKQHQIVGEIEALATYYRDAGADELVFYDITASSRTDTVSYDWVSRVAKLLDIPFCVAGGIRSVEAAANILAAGADKISINSPALENPKLIDEMVKQFGSQCVVIGIDSHADIHEQNYVIYQYTGDEKTIQRTARKTVEWVQEVQSRGAGEIVLNCMNQDGMRKGYDIKQLFMMKQYLKIPLIASGGAGRLEHFRDVFLQANVEGALAASIFHSKEINIQILKQYLRNHKIEVRL